MSTKKHITSSTLFERTVRQSLFRKDRVTLFDSNWSVMPDKDSDTIILRLAKLADLSFHPFDGASFNEQELVEALLSPAAAKSFDLSNLALLANVMKQQKQSLIVIRNSHKLNYDVVKFLARLVKFARRSNIPCKFLLFADVASMDISAMFQLSIDRAYPKSIERVIREREHPVEAQIDSATTGLKKAGSGFIERLSDRLFG